MIIVMNYDMINSVITSIFAYKVYVIPYLVHRWLIISTAVFGVLVRLIIVIYVFEIFAGISAASICLVISVYTYSMFTCFM